MNSGKGKRSVCQFLKSTGILILALYTFSVQTFLPVFAVQPICSESGPACDNSSYSPVCSNGKVGTVVCNSFGIGCLTTISLFPGDVTCVFNGTGSSGFTCSPIQCPLPPPNCSYINIPRDANGCQIGCGTLSCVEDCSLIPVPLSPYSSLFNPISRISEANSKTTVADKRKTVLENLRNALINNTTKPCNGGVSGVDNSDINAVINAVNGVSLYKSDLTSTRDFWTGFSNYKTCLNTNFFFNNTLMSTVNLEGLLGALHLGQSFDADENTPGIQPVSGVNNSDLNAEIGRAHV